MFSWNHDSGRNRPRAASLWVAGSALLLVGIGVSHLHAQASPENLSAIPAGTPVDMSDATWNRVILLARPKLVSGSVDLIPSSVRNTIPTFVLTLMASVTTETDPATGQLRYRLADVGAAYSMELNDELVIINSDEQRRLGANLGLIQRRLLSTNEEQLATTAVVARTSTLLVFDTPAILVRSDEHQDFVMRHFVWVDSTSGKNSALVWLLRKNGESLSVVAEQPMRWVPAGTKELREIHVDKGAFILGIPTERAFALEDLPPGKDIAWSQRAARIAALPGYDPAQTSELVEALREALAAAFQSPRDR